MRIKSIPMILRTAGRLGMICGGLVLCAFAKDSCSNETFHGDYGFTADGVLLPAGAASIPIKGVQLIHADGKGNLTDSESFVIGGDPAFGGTGPGFFSEHHGTYTVDSNCTGIAFLTNGTNYIWLAMILDEKGKQVRCLAVPPYDSGGIPRVITSIGQRVEDSPFGDKDHE
jgi:hypothetical protein